MSRVLSTLQEVLREENGPHAWLLLVWALRTSGLVLCANCGAVPQEDSPQNAAFGRCGRCILTTYCSRRCQERDWGRHKEVCMTRRQQLQWLAQRCNEVHERRRNALRQRQRRIRIGKGSSSSNQKARR